MDLKIKTEQRKEGVYIISLTGPLDSVTNSECEEKVESLLGPSTKAIVFNMEGLDYISSIGFSVFIKAKYALVQNSGVLAITNLKPGVKRVFDMMKIVPECIFDTMEDVDKYLNKSLSA
ncbi:MAG: STAS domain-containing protein [Candidatus Omnitrophica bacterium]|nr:STAS domain-containing protein [Candidatus Omnitrophota bacterium]